MKCSDASQLVTAAQATAILDLYVHQRLAGTVVARQLGLPSDRVYQFLHHRGVTRPQGGGRAKISPAQRPQLKRELRTTPDATLARKYGVTRERIRQIRQALGYVSSQVIRQKLLRRAQIERQARHQLARQQRRVAEQAAKLVIIDWLSERWQAGMTMKAIAAEAGVTWTSVAGRIAEARAMFPDKFPCRHQPPRLGPATKLKTVWEKRRGDRH